VGRLTSNVLLPTDSSFYLNPLMQKPSKNIVTVIIILSLIAIVVGYNQFKQQPQQESTLDLSRIKGNANAPVKIMEFIDFQCPACAYGSKYIKKFMKDHPDVVQLEMKYFPLKMHAHGYISARYAECAARQDKFWPFHDQLIEKQENWKNLISPIPAFEIMVKDVGLDEMQLRHCLQDESVMEFIEKSKGLGQSKGVKSTPSYFVNDEMIVGGQKLRKKLNQYLEDLKN